MHDSISALIYASTPPIAPLHFYFLLLAMAAAEAPAAPVQADETPTGPQQRGRGSSGQYVYWVTRVYPKPETIARLGVRTPHDFDRAAFIELIVKIAVGTLSGHRVIGSLLDCQAGFVLSPQ